MKVISVMNIKGGVGKTLTAVTLARGFAKKGFKTLLIDADGQSNASTSVMPEESFIENPEKVSLVDFFRNFHPAAFEDCIYKTSIENLYLLPSNLELFLAAIDIQHRVGGEKILSKALAKTDFDYVVIDNNPSVTKLTDNAIAAANCVICPVAMQEAAIQGMVNTYKLVSQHVDALDLAHPVEFKVLVTMKPRGEKAEQLIKLMRSMPQLEGNFFNTEISYQREPAEWSIRENKSLLETYNKKRVIAEEYRRLVDEVIGKVGA